MSKKFEFHYALSNHRTALLGKELPHPMTATEALEQAGNYDVRLVPASPYQFNGIEVKNESYGIIGGPFDGNYVVYGNVQSDNYPLIGPKKVCDLWDTHVNKPVDTIAALKNGSVFVLQSKLGECDIKGDQSVQYLTLIHPLNGRDAIQTFVTDVFLWCTNQIQSMLRKADVKGKIRHNAYTEHDLIEWLKFLPKHAQQVSSVMCEVYNILADTPVTDDILEISLNEVLPLPDNPENKVMPQAILNRHLESYDPRMRKVIETRQGVLNLFNGEMVDRGIATHGTMFGLLQAYTETFQHSGYRISDPATRVYQNTLGPKAEHNAKALKTVLDLANVQVSL